MTSIRTLIRLIVEADAYQRRHNKPFDLTSVIKQYVTNTEPPAYFLTMTELPKVGVNPRSKYNTPIGIYTYPLDDAHFAYLVEDKLPFQSDTEFFSIIEATDPYSMLVVGRKNVNGIVSGADFERAMKLFGIDVTEAPRDDGEPTKIEMVNDVNKFLNYNNDAALFGSMFALSRKSKKPNVAWTSMLLKAGYTAVYDSGFGVIHENEPIQCVFLTPSAYRTVGTWRTSDLRRHNPNQMFNRLRREAYEKDVSIISLCHDDSYLKFSDENSKFMIENAIAIHGADLETSNRVFDFFEKTNINFHVSNSIFSKLIHNILTNENTENNLVKLKKIIDHNFNIKWARDAHYLMILDVNKLDNHAIRRVLTLIADGDFTPEDMQRFNLEYLLRRYEMSSHPNIRVDTRLNAIKHAWAVGEDVPMSFE